jgi:hypothetical protein
MANLLGVRFITRSFIGGRRRLRATRFSMKFLVPIAISLAVVGAPFAASAAEYYVAPTGSDAADGSEAAPWASMAHAQSAVTAGDTVYFRDGTYAYTSGTSTCSSDTATINAIELTKSGAAGKLISYVAYAGETPVFDFAGIKDSCRVTGIRVTASFLHLTGLEIRGVPQNNTANHESWGIWNSGSNNVYELLNLHDNMGPGLFISDGGQNLVLNCDSHDNFDPNSSTGPGTNADGFGCHIGASGTGNVFRGCRSWYNSDDGYDFIQAQVPVLIENSWAFYNGYLAGTTTASGGDGNGFKGGGYGSPPTHVPTTPPQHTIQNCVSFRNRASGFYANHHPVANFWYNDTAYDNKSANFNMLGLDGSTAINVGVLRNDLAFTGTALANGTGGMVDDQFDSWDASLGVTVSAADFQSVDVTGWDGPRAADGSLPVLTSLHLANGSDLIDEGTDVGLPYAGSKPDLGAFETGLVQSTGGSAAGGAAGESSVAGMTSFGGGAGRTSVGGAAGRSMMTAGAGPSSGASSGGATSGGATGANGGTTTSGAGTSSTGATGGTGNSSGGSSGTTSGAAGGRNGGSGGSTPGSGALAGAGLTGNASSGTKEDAGGCGCRASKQRPGASTAFAIAWLAVLLRRRRARAGA